MTYLIKGKQLLRCPDIFEMNQFCSLYWPKGKFVSQSGTQNNISQDTQKLHKGEKWPQFNHSSTI